MSLVRFDDVSLAFGEQHILIETELQLEPGERVLVLIPERRRNTQAAGG